VKGLRALDVEFVFTTVGTIVKHVQRPSMTVFVELSCRSSRAGPRPSAANFTSSSVLLPGSY